MTDAATPMVPWVTDPKLDALLDGYAAVERERVESGRTWRNGTVQSYDPATARARVLIDGDPPVSEDGTTSGAIPVQVIGENLAINGRCVVAFVPPHGAYVIGGLGFQHWTSYTPEVAFNAGLNLGDGFAAGAYRRHDDVVDYRIRFIWGSTTTGGGTNETMRFGLPFPAADTGNIGHPAGAAIILGGAAHPGRGWYPAFISPQDVSYVVLVSGGIGSNAGITFVDRTDTFGAGQSWSVGDGAHIAGRYEPA